MSYPIKPDQIISDYYDAILAHCNFKLNFDTVTAYEITQEAFYQLLLHWDQIRSKNEPVLVSWLYKTSDVLIKKHFRIKKSEEKIMRMSEFDEESVVDYVFPLLRFHSRITELTSDDFKYIFTPKKVSHSGYLMQKGIVPMTGEQEEGRTLRD